MSTNAMPTQGDAPVPRLEQTGFISNFIRGNYFYFLSAAFMLLGCYLLMDSPFIKGTVFVHTLKTLLILQGYELLVIFTALVIVRRLKILDDAFSLLIVEFILLLDPTFFSNAFYTMLRVEASAVNVICFLLVPVKLAILAYGLKFRLTRQGAAAFLFAALFVYVIEGPVNQVNPFPWISRSGYYYFLTWCPLVFLLIMPRVRINFVAADENYISERKQKTLNTLLCVIPLVVFLTHLIEDARTHEFHYFMFHVAPLVLAALVFIIKNNDVAENAQALVRLSDLFLFFALFFSSGLTNMLDVQSKAVYSWAAIQTPAYAEYHVPLICMGAAAVAVYGYIYWKFRCRPAMWRIVILAMIAAAQVFRIDAVQAALLAGWQSAIGFVGQLFRSGASHVHPRGMLDAVWAWLRPAAQFGIRWSDEVIGLMALVILAQAHVRNKNYPRAFCYAVAAVMAACAFHRFAIQPAAWSGAVVVIEIALLVAAGVYYQFKGYLAIAAALGFLFAADLMLITNHVHWIPWLVWAAMLTMLIWQFNRPLATVFGIFTIIQLVRLVPGENSEWIPEKFEGALLAILIMDHWFGIGEKEEKSARYFGVFMIALLGLGRYADSHSLWAGAVVVAEMVMMIGAGILLAHAGYVVIGLLMTLGWGVIEIVHYNVPPAVVIVALGLAFFAFGIVVTFNKHGLLEWLNRKFPPPPKPELPPKQTAPAAPEPTTEMPMQKPEQPQEQ